MCTMQTYLQVPSFEAVSTRAAEGWNRTHVTGLACPLHSPTIFTESDGGLSPDPSSLPSAGEARGRQGEGGGVRGSSKYSA